MYKPRSYRSWVKGEDLVVFEVIESQTDLLISATKNLEGAAREAVLNYRSQIEDYIRKNPVFYTSLEPIDIKSPAPEIINVMVEASRKAGVGPMAAIAGAIAEFVGRTLANFSDEVIVENGGDIFLKTQKIRNIGIYAGDKSPFTGKLAIEIGPSKKGLGVCTSSGTVSHSLSFGKADAALIISENTALADAVATAAGNMVKDADHIEAAINFAKSIEGVIGVLILVQDKMGSWGNVRIV